MRPLQAYRSLAMPRGQQPKKLVPDSVSDKEILKFLLSPGPESQDLPESALVKELFGIDAGAILRGFKSLKDELKRAQVRAEADPSDAHLLAMTKTIENLSAYLEDQRRLGLALQHWAVSMIEQHGRLGTS